MPGFVLHLGATVRCAHAGTAMPISTSPRVRVGGQPIVTMVDMYSVAGCAMPPPIAGNGPCVTASWIIGSTRVRSGGSPVILLDSQAICVPTATPLLLIQAQSRVRGT